jgi:polar amino acid transport system substrate-binding protein
MKLKKFVSALMMSASLCSLASCSSNNPDLLSTIVSKKELVVGLEATYKPFEYTDTAGNIVGFDVDFMGLVEKKIESTYNIDLTLTFKDLAFDGLITSVQSGQIDVICSAMTITEEREKSVSFSDPYFDSKSVVVVKTSSSIASMDDLKAAKVGAQLGTEQASYITADGWNSSNMVVTKVSDLSLALESGQIDALVLDQAVAQSLIAAYRDMTILDSIDFEDAGSFGVALSKTNTSELLSLINTVIADSKADGSLTTLYNEAVEKANA